MKTDKDNKITDYLTIDTVKFIKIFFFLISNKSKVNELIKLNPDFI